MIMDVPPVEWNQLLSFAFASVTVWSPGVVKLLQVAQPPLAVSCVTIAGVPPSSGLMQNGQPVRGGSPASWNPFAFLSKYLQTVIGPVGGGVGLAEHVSSSPCLAQLG